MKKQTAKAAGPTVVRLVPPGARLPVEGQVRRSRAVYQFACKDLAGPTDGTGSDTLFGMGSKAAPRKRRGVPNDPAVQMARQNALLRFIEMSLRQVQLANGEDDEPSTAPEVVSDRVRTLWLAYPNLAAASLQLVGMLGGQWRESDREPPLVVRSIYEAVEETKQMVENELIPPQSTIGCYLSHLAMIGSRCVYFETVGICSDGKRVAWDRFTEPIHEWVQESDVQTIEIVNLAERPDRNSVIGAKGRLLAAICTERDLGAALLFK